MRKLLLMLLVLFLFSCQKENTVSMQSSEIIELKVDRLALKDLILIAESLEKKGLISNNYYHFDKKVEESNNDILIDIVFPLIEIGDQIHSELINQIIGSPDWQSLSECDRESIISMSDIQKAQLAFIYIDVIDPDFNNPILISDNAIDRERAQSCLLAALGISAINDIIAGTGGLLTVQSSVQLLKTIGKRYLGYIGLAYAVYEFVNCVS